MGQVSNFYYHRTPEETFKVYHSAQPNVALFHCKDKETADYITYWLDEIEQNLYLPRLEKFPFQYVAEYVKEKVPDIENMQVEELLSIKAKFVFYIYAATVWHTTHIKDTFQLYNTLLYKITRKHEVQPGDNCPEDVVQPVCLERFINDPDNKEKQIQFGVWLEAAYMLVLTTFAAVGADEIPTNEEVEKEEFNEKFNALLCDVYSSLNLEKTNHVKELVNKYRKDLNLDTINKVKQYNENNVPYLLKKLQPN